MDITSLPLILMVNFITIARPRFWTTVLLASSLFSVIVKANLAVPGTITSSLPRLGNRTSSCWFWSMLLGLLVMTTDCRTPLTPRGLRRERYGLSLRPNLLEAIVYWSCATTFKWVLPPAVTSYGWFWFWKSHVRPRRAWNRRWL